MRAGMHLHVCTAFLWEVTVVLPELSQNPEVGATLTQEPPLNSEGQ